MALKKDSSFCPTMLKGTEEKPLVVNVEGVDTFKSTTDYYERLLLNAYMQHLKEIGKGNVAHSSDVLKATSFTKPGYFGGNRTELWVRIDYDMVPQHEYHAPIPDPPKTEKRSQEESKGNLKISRSAAKTK